MKLSLITTVFNEQETIIKFLESVFTQTKLPDEIIIVDGGSTDNTLSEISKFKFPQNKKVPNIKILFKKGNRSIGRNEAIKNAKGEIILSSDSGNILDKNWVKNITKPFSDKTVDVVAGYYKGISQNIFQKSLIPYVLVMDDKVDENNFLPATRSMAFKKNVWKKIGGFDEKLSHNEDYAFARKLQNGKFKICFAKNAVANWMPRKNLKAAFIMFFRFAFGDTQAKLFREKVVYIFLRYIFAIYLILLSVIERSIYLYGLIVICFMAYVVWSVWKNYRYVKNPKALFYLPLLQFVSDFAVLSGTTLGFIRNLSFRPLIKIILNNKGTAAVIAVYALSMLSVISYGIPGPNHPFDYFMDEWHQSQSVRDLFRYGTPNISGAANGSIFQFFLTGIYLIPFYLMHIVNPFAIKSSVINLDTQFRLFEVLRLNTLLFGISSIILVAYISKKYFKINSFAASFLFTFNPLWITLSNYFKYDIALQFWILLAFLFMLRFAEKQKLLDFIMAGIFSSLALATKLEPFNLLIVYVLIFAIFTQEVRKKIKIFFSGLFIYAAVFFAFGIPDIMLGKGSLNEYLSSNLSSVPNATSNIYKLGMDYWLYFLKILYPVSFGRVFYFAFIFSVVLGVIALFRYVIIKRSSLIGIIYNNKPLAVLFLMFFSYALSLVPMRIGALANRLIPLLPFMAIATVYAGEYLYRKIRGKSAKVFILFLIFILLSIQFAESYAWNFLKTENNPRTSSSKWITENIKQGTVIGIENIPIYQMLPDVILKEFYLKQYGRGQENKYKYEVINSKSPDFPNTVIISNDYLEENYLTKSDKKIIIQKLKNQDYKQVKVFNLQSKYFYIFNSRLEYYMSALIQLPDTITVYEKL